MKKVVLFDLVDGGGDHDLFFTEPDIYAWVTNNHYPDNPNWTLSHWIDSTTPVALKKAHLLEAGPDADSIDGCVSITRGSAENDRAIAARHVELPFSQLYGTLKDMLDIAKEQDWEIEEIYQGHMY